LLAFMLPVDEMEWQAGYDRLRREIAEYSKELAAKPHCVVFTKMDLLGDDDPPPLDAPDAFGIFAISAAGRTGLDALLAAWWSRLLSMRTSAQRAHDEVALP
jgi:GTP-binding protein